MPRQPKLQRKNGYWYSEAGGTPRYFGKIGVVSYDDAIKRFREQLAGPTTQVTEPSSPARAEPSSPVPTVAELVMEFTSWLEKNRSGRTLDDRARHLRRWCEAVGKLPATSIRAEHLNGFRESLEDLYEPDYVRKHMISVRYLFNKSVKMGWLPPEFRPFTGVEAVKVPVELLHEADLMTKEEIILLLRYADADLSPICIKRVFRKRRPEEYRTGEKNPWRGFEDMLRCFHATGARTHELAQCQVADFQPRSRQLLLGNHKRSFTLKRDEARQITLNDAAYSIVEQLCRGRDRNAPLFTQPVHGRQRLADQPWDRISLARRFRSVRRLAGVREEITIYSFRHLWISDMLAVGVDPMLVARMAGTSLAMIERVYGHFRSESLQDAQTRLDEFRAKRS